MDMEKDQELEENEGDPNYSFVDVNVIKRENNTDHTQE